MRTSPGAPYPLDAPWDGENEHRFNSTDLLLDPYAKAIDGTIRWSDASFGSGAAMQRRTSTRMTAAAPPLSRRA